MSGLLHARLARSSVGNLFVELRAAPGPSDLRFALARVLRDPSLSLVYWLPEFGSYADDDGRAVELPDPGGDRAMTVIDRGGEPVAALLHDPSLKEPELLEAVTAGAAIALEDAQLHVELRARLEELRGSRARIVKRPARSDSGWSGTSRRAQQRLVALSLELSLLEERLNDDPQARAQVEQARSEVATSLQERTSSHAGSIPPS